MTGIWLLLYKNCNWQSFLSKPKQQNKMRDSERRETKKPQTSQPTNQKKKK